MKKFLNLVLPSSGTYTAIKGGPFVNAGAKQFMPPGHNHDGESYWILLLDASADAN